MITLSTTRDQDRIAEILAGAVENNGRGYNPTFSLSIDGQDITRRFLAGEWGQVETPITLDADIAGYLPERLDGGEVEFSCKIEGIEIPQLHGVKTAFFAPDEPFITNMLSSSAGAYLNSDDAIKLRRFTEYFGARPQDIAYDALRRLPFDQSQIQIEPVNELRLTYAGHGVSPGFKAEEKTGDVLSRLKTQVGYDFRDTQNRGHVAEIPIPLGNTSRPVRGEQTYRADKMPNWFQYRPYSPEVRYRYVRVFREDSYGNLAYEVIEEVPYSDAGGAFPPLNLARLPYEDQVLDIPIEDDSPQGPDNARIRAQEQALNLARGIRVGTDLTLPIYDPLHQRADRFRVLENLTDDDGSWEILWAFRTESFKHSWGTGRGSGAGLTGQVGTTVSYTSAILAKDRIKSPSLILPPSLGIHDDLPPPIIPDPYGVEGDDIYFNDDPSISGWVSSDGADLIFNSDAGDLISVEGDEVVVKK